jgi:nitroreductase
MDDISPVLKRRSIRSFRKDDVPEKELLALVEAGMAAACARGIRSWHFTVIREREALDRIPEIHPYSSMMRTATAAILVCADPSVEPTEGYWAQNCSAATQNVLVEGAVRGIGTVWLGVYPRRERIQAMRRFFKVPEKLIPFSLIAVGWPDEEKPPHSGVEEKRFRWGSW